MHTEDENVTADSIVGEYESSVRTLLAGDENDIQAAPEDKAQRKLHDLRKLSNVIQAMENLVTQCSTVDQFHPLRLIVSRELAEARKALIRNLHQP